MKKLIVLLLLAAFTSCEKEIVSNEIEHEKIRNETALRIDDYQTLETAKKTSHGDQCTHISVIYTHGYYVVSITNYTTECTSYRIDFPDEYTRKETRKIPAGETLNYHYTAPLTHGAVIVTPTNQYPALRHCGSVQANI